MKKKENVISKNKLNLDKIILNDNFDIKNYIKDIQKQIKLERTHLDFNKKNIFPSLKNNLYSLKKKKEMPFLNTNNINLNDNLKRRNKFIFSLKNKKHQILLKENNLSSNSIDINNKINNDLFNWNNSKSKLTKTINNTKCFSEQNSINSLNNKNINKTSFKTNKENSKSLISIFNNKNTFLTSDPRFNVSKDVSNSKEINNLSNIILNNFKKKLKKIQKNFSTLNNKKVLYEKKYKYAILEPLNILKDFEKKKQMEFLEEDKSVNKFITNKREMSVKNLILKLINSEVNKLIDNESKNDNKLLNLNNILEQNRMIFEEYKYSQKKACRHIENILSAIQKNNRALFKKKYNLYYDNEIMKEEIKKILEKINEYSNYGKFINEFFNKDITIFENIIIPENYDNKINYDLLIKNVINKYKCFLNEEIINDKYKIENEPKEMILKLKEMENNIIELINNNEEIKIDICKIKEQNKDNLKYLIERYNFLEEEYKLLYEIYIKELNKCNIYEEKINKKKFELENMIYDFYIFINYIFGNENNINSNIILDYIKKIENIIYKLENLVDELINNLNYYEKNDKKYFEESLHKRKNEIKNYKQNLIKQKIINENIKERQKIEINKNKIYFIERKTEKNILPKKVNKVIYDEKYKKKLEDEELIK